MKKATLEALKKSIAKWKRIVRSSKAEDRGDENCPLCKLFFDNRPSCYGCPVLLKVGVSHCCDTPYREWAVHGKTQHRDEVYPHRVPGCKTCMKLAKEELAFLEGLLP